MYYKMINLDNITNKNKELNKKWPYIPDHSYRILINEQDHVDKVYLYTKDVTEPKY